MLLNINLEKHHFDSFAEIIKIKNSLVDALKDRLCDSEKLNFTLNDELKKMHVIFLECQLHQ